jgi:hypothetical protein
MKIIFTLFVFVISVNLFGQTRSEIIVTMNEYSENKGNVPYNINFTEEKLNPALIKLQSLTCKAGDEKLFDSFLEMILKTTGSANEVPADVLAEIFICRTELVENRLNGKYKNDFLTELLEFGFKNITHQNKIANQSELEKRINKLKK